MTGGDAFGRFAGLCAVALGGIGVAYSIAFVVFLHNSSRGAAYLAFLSAALLVYVYVGRLVILNPKSPGLLAGAVLVGFVVNPVLFVWLGLVLAGVQRFDVRAQVA